jgi:hypothetical protein
MSIRDTNHAWGGDLETRIFAAAMVAVIATMVAGLLWVAWRLWRHWSADTARIVTAVFTGLAAIYILGLISKMLPTGAASTRSKWVWDVAAMLLLILAAVTYRRASRAMIRWAELDDPRDPHGHPTGHMQRVRLFCVMLGISVWLAGSSAFMEMLGSRVPLVALAAPMLGWASYRIALWRMTPPTQAALVPGSGFDVLPPK